MNTTYLILLLLFIVSLAIRSGYEFLRESGRIIPGSRLLFAFIFTTMCVLWISWFSLCPLDPFKFTMPDYIRWIGFGIFILGLFLAFGALIQLKGLEDIKNLVTTGLFSKFRHPMYTGFILWIIGWSTFHGAIFSLLIGVVGIANILYWRHLEDSRLLVQFGDDYQVYRIETWF